MPNIEKDIQDKMKSQKDWVEKSLKANIGEVHTWSDGKRYRKTVDGWEEVKDIQEVILEKLEPSIKSLIDKHEEFHLKEGKFMSDRDKELLELSIIHDLLKSLSKYVKRTDILSDIHSSYVRRGSMEISATIIRDGVKFPYTTEVIYAGGYNIQKFHIRYLTHTTLPAVGDLNIADKIKSKIVRLNKVEKLEDEIRLTEKQIKRIELDIKTASSLSDEEIINSNEQWKRSDSTTWADIVSRGVEKNFDYSEKVFTERQAQYRQGNIDSFKRMNIEFKEDSLKSFTKTLQKIKDKLRELN